MARKTTRNAAGGGSIRKKTVVRNGKEYTYWEARYTVENGTGRQIQKSITAKTQGEVRKKLQAVTSAIDSGTFIHSDRTKLTVGQWLNEWLSDFVQPSVKPLTYSSYEAHIRNNLVPYIGGLKIKELTAHHLQILFNSLVKGSADRSPLSPKTIKNLGAVVHKSLSQACKLKYVGANVMTAVELPKVVKKEITPLEPDQITAFLKAIKVHPLENLYITTLFVGMRQGEVLALSWKNVNFEKGEIVVSQQLQKEKGITIRIKSSLEPLVADKTISASQRDKIIKSFAKGATGLNGYISRVEKLVSAGTITGPQRDAIAKKLSEIEDSDGRLENKYFISTPKSSKSRSIKPALIVMHALRNEFAKQAEAKMKSWETWNNENDLVFTDAHGRNLAINSVYKDFKRIAADIGIPTARFHDLRHSFATNALANGDDLKTIQSNLGHASASFTLSTYAHASEVMRQASADRMQRFYLEVVGQE